MYMYIYINMYIVVRARKNSPKDSAISIKITSKTLTILMVPAMLFIGLMPGPILGSVRDLTYTFIAPNAIGSDTKTSSIDESGRLK